MWVVTSATVSRAAGQQHREILHAAAGGEKFGLAGKFETDLVHARLVNRAGHDRVDFAARARRRFFQRRQRGSGARPASARLTSSHPVLTDDR